MRMFSDGPFVSVHVAQLMLNVHDLRTMSMWFLEPTEGYKQLVFEIL